MRLVRFGLSLDLRRRIGRPGRKVGKGDRVAADAGEFRQPPEGVVHVVLFPEPLQLFRGDGFVRVAAALLHLRVTRFLFRR